MTRGAVPIALGLKPRYDECPAEVSEVRGPVTDALEVRVRASGRARRVRSRRPEEVCELCAERIASEHRHLVDLHSRTLMCAVPGVLPALRVEGAGGDHFRSVPERYVAFDDFELTPAQWDSLQIPVSVAFFFLNSSLGRVAAFYPGPAGATESELPLDTWAEVVVGQPARSSSMQPDVEAFLVRAGSGLGGRSAAGPAGRRGGEPSASSCPSTPATSWSATCACCGAASTAAARPTASSTTSSPTSRARARPR